MIVKVIPQDTRYKPYLTASKDIMNLGGTGNTVPDVIADEDECWEEVEGKYNHSYSSANSPNWDKYYNMLQTHYTPNETAYKMIHRILSVEVRDKKSLISSQKEQEVSDKCIDWILLARVEKMKVFG